MKKTKYIVTIALALAMAMPISGVTGKVSVGYGAESAEAKKLYDLPDEEELAANKALKEVVEQWEDTEEWPDYFACVMFCGTDSLYPVIQLTDISEETKRDFLDRVGFEHERWQFQQVPYSRNQLLEICQQVKLQFEGDERIEKIVVSDVAESGFTMVGSVVADNFTYELRPVVASQENAKVWVLVHNEFQYEVYQEIRKLYDEDMVDVGTNMDDATGEIVTEEAVIGDRLYKRYYQINDIRDWAYTGTYICSTMGDYNGNGTIDLEDAREVLKAALKITTISEKRCFSLRYSEDHTGVNLEDAKAILLRALKIEDKWKPHIQILHGITLYRSLEWGKVSMPVQQQIISGRQELLKVIKELDNPELEKYVNKLGEVYLKGDIILTATPVYAESLNDLHNGGYHMKVTDNSWGILTKIIDGGDCVSKGQNQYYIEIGFLAEDIKDKEHEVFYMETVASKEK